MSDDVTKRLNVFDHQFLRAADLQVQLCYDRDRRQRILSGLFTPGVVEGLTLTPTSGAGPFYVTPGTAIDDQGNEIVVIANQPVTSLPAANSSAQLYITYTDALSDPSSDPGITGYTRYTESPQLQSVVPPQAPPIHGVFLATLTADSAGKVTISPSAPPQAGAMLGSLNLQAGATINGNLTLVGPTANPSREVLFQDNGQVRSFDDNHKLVFNRQSNLLELHEWGDIVFMTGGPPTEKMRVTASGDIGIGTSTPGRALEVAAADANTGIKITGSTSNRSWLMAVGVTAGDGKLSFYDYGAAAAVAHRLTIDTNGNVGIATTTPGFALDVADRIRLRQGPSGTAGLWLYQTTPAADHAFVGMASDTQVGLWGNTGAQWGLVMDTTSGKVGVGTTAPHSILEVEAPGTASGPTGTGPALTLTNSTGGAGAMVALDFNTFPPSATGTYNASSRIAAVDDGGWLNDIVFLMNKPGGANNGFVENLRLTSDGHIKSPMWKATQVLNQQPGPLPAAGLSGKFTSGGGTLLIIASGSGFAAGAGIVGMNIEVDGNLKGSAKCFTNEPNSHKSFTANALVVTGIAAGSHVLLLLPLAATTESDGNDFFSVTVLELPI